MAKQGYLYNQYNISMYVCMQDLQGHVLCSLFVWVIYNRCSSSKHAEKQAISRSDRLSFLYASVLSAVAGASFSKVLSKTAINAFAIRHW